MPGRYCTIELHLTSPLEIHFKLMINLLLCGEGKAIPVVKDSSLWK